MLILEIREDLKAKTYKILPGLYRIGEYVAEGVYICEYNGKYEGIVEVRDDSITRIFSYKLSTQTQIRKGFIEYILPNVKFINTWANIIYNEQKKHKLLDLLLKFCFIGKYGDLLDAFAINKMILLHGPPGTGKSTLSRALAQKLAIRSGIKFTLKEIKCSQIFSKFYGESLHILTEIFDTADSNTIFIIDEIESLLVKRSIIIGKNEPCDSLRLVNTFLTIIDQCNSIFIFTSNFIDHLDQAFVDRCDLITEMSHPSPEIIYKIMVDTFIKIGDAGLIQLSNFMTYDQIYKFQGTGDLNSYELFSIAQKCKSISGRKIKKIIFKSLDTKFMETEELIHNIQQSILSDNQNEQL